jgi:hypothetical protein
MGVALYVQGYFKHPESISGQIKALGYYEVDTEAIESHKIDNSFTVIHEGLNSIEAISKTFYYYGFEDAGELSFYQNIMSALSGHGMRYEQGKSYGVMFDGKRIYQVISNILDHFDMVNLRPDQIDIEKENLINLQNCLRVIAENDGLVGFVWS